MVKFTHGDLFPVIYSTLAPGALVERVLPH